MSNNVTTLDRIEERIEAAISETSRRGQNLDKLLALAEKEAQRHLVEIQRSRRILSTFAQELQRRDFGEAELTLNLAVDIPDRAVLGRAVERSEEVAAELVNRVRQISGLNDKVAQGA